MTASNSRISSFLRVNKPSFTCAQTVQEYRNIDLLILILVFERFESAVEKSVLYAVDQIRNNTFQPESKSLFAFLSKSKIKP